MVPPSFAGPGQQQQPMRGSMHPPANVPNTGRGVKRNSSSPSGDTSDTMGKDQSPRAAKRSRPSPNINSGNPNPIPSPMHHQGPPGPGGAGGPPHPQSANMPNGVPQQRPGSVTMGGPMNMAHQPTPMAMQPTGPQGNLQPNTMVPQPGNTNAVMMVTPQMGGNYYRNAPQKNQGPNTGPGPQGHEGPNPGQGAPPYNPAGIMGGLPGQAHQKAPMMMPGRPGMMQPPSAPQSAQGGVKLDQSQQQQPQPPQQSHQQPDAAPPLAPAHASGGPQVPNGILNNGNNDGRHSAPATTNPSPNIPTNGSGNATGASPAGGNTPASGANGNASVDASPHNNPSGAPNGIQRSTTAPVTAAEQGLPSSNIAPGLFDGMNGLDLNSLIGPGGFEGLEGFTDFERDFGQWFDAN